MVDSGSFVTIASVKEHVGSEHIVQPSDGSRNGVKYSSANGGEIVNRGQAVITHALTDDIDLDIPFQDADVQLPILSVTDFIKIRSRV